MLDVGASDGYFSFELEKRGADVLAVDTNNFDGKLAISPSPRHAYKYEKKYSLYQSESAPYGEIYRELNVPYGHRFLLAKTLLNSKVEYKVASIYELDKLGEKFDLIFCGALIEHLKNPIEAVEQMHRNLAPNGVCIVALSSCLKPLIPLPVSKLLDIAGVRVLRSDRGLSYNGNISGGSFFHFYPETFRQLLLASGFKEVEIYSTFAVRNQSRKERSDNNNTVFHCRN